MTKALKSSKPKIQLTSKRKKDIFGAFQRRSSFLGVSRPVQLLPPESTDSHPKRLRNGTAVSTAGDFEQTHIIALSGGDYLQLQRLIDDPPSLNENTVRAIEAMRRKA